MKNYRTFNAVEESYFRDHPEEIDDYIKLIFEAYAEDGNTGALLSSLRVLSRVKGVTKIAELSCIRCWRNGVIVSLDNLIYGGFESLRNDIVTTPYTRVPTVP